MIAPGRDPPAWSRGATRASCFRSHASVRASSRSTATYRAAIETVRRLAAVLAALPGVDHVRILTLPLELGSEHALTGAAYTTPEAAAFEMRVTLRVAVPGAAQA